MFMFWVHHSVIIFAFATVTAISSRLCKWYKPMSSLVNSIFYCAYLQTEDSLVCLITRVPNLFSFIIEEKMKNVTLMTPMGDWFNFKCLSTFLLWFKNALEIYPNSQMKYKFKANIGCLVEIQLGA